MSCYSTARRGSILDAILCAALSGEGVAESTMRGVRSQGSYSRSTIAVDAGFTVAIDVEALSLTASESGQACAVERTPS